MTAGDTYQFINKDTPGHNTGIDGQENTFEFRYGILSVVNCCRFISLTSCSNAISVTNWALGVQLHRVHVAKGARIYGIPEFKRKIEFVGDSLTAGYTATYEAISSFAWGLAEGLGNVEFSMTACKRRDPCGHAELSEGADSDGDFRFWYLPSRPIVLG